MPRWRRSRGEAICSTGAGAAPHQTGGGSHTEARMMTTSDQEVPWVSDARSAWLEQVRAWLHAELCRRGLEPHGACECVSQKPWAIVLRVPTPQGFVYFKASGPGGRHEPGLITAL